MSGRGAVGGGSCLNMELDNRLEFQMLISEWRNCSLIRVTASAREELGETGD